MFRKTGNKLVGEGVELWPQNQKKKNSVFAELAREYNQDIFWLVEPQEKFPKFIALIWGGRLWFSSRFLGDSKVDELFEKYEVEEQEMKLRSGIEYIRYITKDGETLGIKVNKSEKGIRFIAPKFAYKVMEDVLEPVEQEQQQMFEDQEED